MYLGLKVLGVITGRAIFLYGLPRPARSPQRLHHRQQKSGLPQWKTLFREFRSEFKAPNGLKTENNRKTVLNRSIMVLLAEQG